MIIEDLETLEDQVDKIEMIFFWKGKQFKPKEQLWESSTVTCYTNMFNFTIGWSVCSD